MRTSRHAAFAAALASVAIACSGEDPAPPEPCFGCVPDPALAAGAGIVVQNKTDHSVSFTLRDLGSEAIQIDRKVLDGTIALPIGPAQSAGERSFPLSPEGTTFLGSPVQILSGTTVNPQTGGALRIGTQPFVFAVGRGVLDVRTRDGIDVLEPADPRAVTVLPVDREIAACTDEAFGVKLPEPPARILAGDTMTVTAVTVDTNGCRVFELESGSAAVDYVLCLPDGAYPFDASDALTMSPLSGNGVRFDGASGVVLELLPTRFLSRQSQTPSGIPMVFTEDVTCARVSPGCGDVEIPAKVVFSFDGKTSQTLSVGESIVDPRGADRTVFVLGARTLPVLVPGCSALDSSGVSSIAEVLLASIERPVP